MPNNQCCFMHTLRLIDTLQKKSIDELNCDNTCSKPFLGDGEELSCFNTRPVTFYRCDNSLVSVEVHDDGRQVNHSNVFRIEKVYDCCVLCRVLIPEPVLKARDGEDAFCGSFVATNQTTIINLECICAIKCLNDTFVCL